MVNGEVRFSSIDQKFEVHNQYEEKVTLQFYRDESKVIFAIFKRYVDLLEKCGTDEAYIQVTKDKIDHYPAEFNGIILNSQQPQSPLNEEEELIAKASQLVAEIRSKVWEEAKYKCSAGISFNKMLAKLASGANKPNAQTIILGRLLPDCIRPFRISKIRGFGGKIQQAFNEIGVEKVG